MFHKSSFSRRTSGFTLVELLVSLGAFGLILVSLILTYSSISEANKRLEILRVVQENSRTATELLASEIRNQGVDFSRYTSEELQGSTPIKTLYIKRPLGTSARYYLIKKMDGGVWVGCNAEDNQSVAIQCYLGVMENNQVRPITAATVGLKNLSFFISGADQSALTNLSQEGKVQMRFDIGIPVRVGVKSEVSKSSFVTLQTTVSEKIYRKDSN